jgi:hypothetical protein
MRYYKALDYVQWVYKKIFGIDKSKSQLKKEMEAGAVKLNDRKIKPDDIFEFEDK